VHDPATQTTRSLLRDEAVAGCGWSHVLRHELHAPTLSSELLIGTRRDTSGNEWWGAGLTIRAVLRRLSSRGRTLAGCPSLLDGTLGAWIASKAHGSGGTLWTPVFGALRVADTHTGVVRVVASSKALYDDDAPRSVRRRFVILEVQLRSVPDVECVRVAWDVVDEPTARRVVQHPSHLRAVFVNRTVSTAFVWAPVDDGESAAWPPAYIQPWIAVLVGGLPSHARSLWTRRVRLSSAHAFGPTPPHVGSLVAVSAFENFELIARQSLDGEALWRVCAALQRALSTGRVRGRCDVRFGATKAFYDFALRASSATDRRVLFEALHECGVRVVTLHAGKFQPDDVAPLKFAASSTTSHAS
jgi:hypothetical protein